MWISQAGETKIAAGAVEADLDLRKPWEADALLSGGHPQSPIKLGDFRVRTTDKRVEIELPKKILVTESEVICFEWCNGAKVR